MTTKIQSGIFSPDIASRVFNRKVEQIRLACVENDLPFSRAQIRNAARKTMCDELHLEAALRYGRTLLETYPDFMQVERWLDAARVAFMNNVTVVEETPLLRGGHPRYRLLVQL